MDSIINELKKTFGNNPIDQLPKFQIEEFKSQTNTAFLVLTLMTIVGGGFALYYYKKKKDLEEEL